MVNELYNNFMHFFFGDSAASDRKNVIFDFIDKRLVIDTVNEMIASSNLACDMRAEDDVLVMEYTYLEQLDFGDMTKEDIDALFDESVVPGFVTMADNLVTSFQADYGLTLGDVRLVFYNLDGTLIYEKNLSEI